MREGCNELQVCFTIPLGRVAKIHQYLLVISLYSVEFQCQSAIDCAAPPNVTIFSNRASEIQAENAF